MSALVATADATLPAAMHFARRLGKYTLGETLGEGAMGVVYRAVDPHIDRVVALKTIRKAVLDAPAGKPSAALRFRNEARAAGRLSHPGIVQIYEYGEEGEQSFIAMEYVAGASLLRCTAPQQRLPLADVLSVMTQLLHALNYAHAHGVWHRDIKPSNLIVTPGGQLKITDFGIARIEAAELTQDASIMGSCGYMAPECYRGVEVDQRVDLFACGVLLYELLTGRRPFAGTPSAVMHQLLHDDPPPLADAACTAAEAAALAPYEPIVACAMARDRAQRYPGAQEMLDALSGLAAAPVAPRVSVAAVQNLMTRRTVAAPATVHLLPRKPQPIYRKAAALPAQASAAQPAPALAAAERPDAAHFDPSALATLAALLVPTLGPVARVVVQRAAAKSQGLAALVGRLAHELPSAAERRHFLAQAQQAFGRAEVPHPAKPQSIEVLALPVLGATPLSDEAVQNAEFALMQQVGPIARWIVKQARSGAGSREQFFARLADLAADCIDPERLLVELEQAHPAPR